MGCGISRSLSLTQEGTIATHYTDDKHVRTDPKYSINVSSRTSRQQQTATHHTDDTNVSSDTKHPIIISPDISRRQLIATHHTDGRHVRSDKEHPVHVRSDKSEEPAIYMYNTGETKVKSDTQKPIRIAPDTPSQTEAGTETQINLVEGKLETNKHHTTVCVPETQTNVDKVPTSCHVNRGSETPMEDSQVIDTSPTVRSTIPAYNDESLQLARDSINNHPDLQSGFDDINTFVNLLHHDPEMNSNGDQVRELTSKIVLRSFVNLSESSRRIFSDYMSYVTVSEAIFNLYGAFLRRHGLEFLTESIATNRLSHADLKFIRELRITLWNYTDSSLHFAERVCNSGLLKYFVADLKAIWDECQDVSKISPNDKFFRTARGILHNCAQNPVTRVTIRELGTVQVTLNYLTVKCDPPIIQTTILLLLATIADEEDNKYLIADDTVFTIILKMIQYAWDKPRHRCDGFSVSELTSGLTDLAKNDQNKKILMKKGALPVLMTVMADGSEEEQEKAVQCIWELAFDKDIQKIFQNNKKLTKCLENLKASPNKKLAKVVAGALWEINQEKKVEKELKESPRQVASGSVPTGHVMISYQWADQKIMIKVKDMLRSHGYNVWMDIDNMEGSTLQAMAEAVQNAAVVLVCMSERYKESQNCRSEAEYAFDVRKPIVPLLMQRGYKPDGWLGLIKGSKLFFDFSGKYQFDNKAADLTRELGERGKRIAAIDNVDTGPLVKTQPADVGRGSGNVLGWSNKDVSNWLSKIGLQNHSSLKTLTGKQLAFLRKLSYKAPEFFYGYLKTDLHLCNLEDMMNFSEAVESL